MIKKFLIVGAGMIGEVHAQTLTDMGYELALCDAFEQNLNRLGDKFQISDRYTSVDEALEQSGAQAVVICTPNHLHAEVAVKAMEKGYDVLCEKPMAATVEQARTMLEAANKTGRHLMIGYIVRAYDALDKVMEILGDGTLGKVVSARCVLATPETLDVAMTTYRKSYETGGGIIYDYTHELDYCRMMFGTAKEAFAFCGSYLRRDESVDDSADMLIRYESGVVLSLHMDYIQRTGRTGYSRSFEIICEKGTVECDFRKVRVHRNDGTKEEFTFEPDWGKTFPKQAERFIRLCAGEAHVPHASGEDGLKALELADALYRSSREGILIRDLTEGKV